MKPVAQINHAQDTEQILYLYSDHLMTNRLATNATQHIVWRWEGEAFGNTPAQELIGISVNLRLPGQYFDEETNLHYNHFRYYDPTLGRYITSDPIGLKGGLNTYSYAQQNTLTYIDRLGLVDTGRHPGPGGGDPSACDYYDQKCNESQGDCDGKDCYACAAAKCCRSFGDNPKSNCTRECLIRWDKSYCGSLSGSDRAWCRFRGHFLCYIGCSNDQDLLFGPHFPWDKPECKGAMNCLRG